MWAKGELMSHLGASHIAAATTPHTDGHPSHAPDALTREARVYAIKELARRAGVTRDFFRTWKIEFSHLGTTIHVLPGTQKRVFFPTAPGEIWQDFAQGSLYTARLGWLNESAIPSIQNAVVPFVHKHQAHSKALFQSLDSECLECTVDLPLSALLVLSCCEERFTQERDSHGRVPASASLAYREGFLQRPIVDEYGLAFQQALESLMPNWKPSPRQFRVNVSHDIDNIGVPFNLRSTLGHTLRRRDPASTVRDIVGLLPGINPTLLESVRHLVTLSLRRGLEPAVYWKGVRKSQRGYDPLHPKVRAMVAWLEKYGIEMGVHPGYHTFRAPDKLRKEVLTVREILGSRPIGGRQDYLRWCPDLWLDWENCGLAYDGTVGYADHIGFRAGTCIPYCPWLFALNRPAKLLELPLIVMDCTLSFYMKLNMDQSLIAVSEAIEQCKKVGGVFAMLWHNDSMLDPDLDALLQHVLDPLSGSRKYDLLNPPKDLY
jgi:hypothetical protein